ncbi:hypothetical protein DM01DRAFT_1333563 [Hesseltinella vesiculosa]|uniref:J domain-containing protein n=1 Tax=Hesseltinella vesiculosa TaxID=101127 RepID=A0A1X2GQ73_9FUNG|nr:hypothetical protein DM01DRAFT_1333563 [Hesseltinella vesiculosa]
MKNPYQVLGIGRYASQKEIKKQYLSLVKRHHPDVIGHQQQQTTKYSIADINRAYELLTKHKNQVQQMDRPSPFYEHTEKDTKRYTHYSLLAGLALMASVVAYIVYEPSGDPDLAYSDHRPTNSSAQTFREWRKTH